MPTDTPILSIVIGFVAIGFGLNLSLDDADHDAIGQPAASLERAAGRLLEREPLLLVLLDSVLDEVRVLDAADEKPPEPAPELEAWLRQLAGGRPVLVAGSTMAGEETRVLDAFAIAHQETGALLVLAPRHPERFDEVWNEVRRRFPAAVRRSQPRPTPSS